MTLEQLEQEALKLNPLERARLAELLYVSVDPATEKEIQQLWAEESGRRDAEMETGIDRGRPIEEVLAELGFNMKSSCPSGSTDSHAYL